MVLLFFFAPPTSREAMKKIVLPRDSGFKKTKRIESTDLVSEDSKVDMNKGKYDDGTTSGNDKEVKTLRPDQRSETKITHKYISLIHDKP